MQAWAVFLMFNGKCKMSNVKNLVFIYTLVVASCDYIIVSKSVLTETYNPHMALAPNAVEIFLKNAFDAWQLVHILATILDPGTYESLQPGAFQRWNGTFLGNNLCGCESL